MIETAFQLLLLINLTGVYRLLALPVGDSAVVSATLLLINLAYLVYRFPIVVRLVGQASFFEWAAVILLWPVASLLLLALGGEVGPSALRAFLVQLYLLSLMLSAAVFVTVRGWVAFRRIAVVAVGIAVVGTLWNWQNPQFFYRLGAAVADDVGKISFATATSNQISQFKRASGFFIEPNLAALSCNMLMLALLARYRRTSIKMKIAIVIFMQLLIGASGSRGGILVSLVVGSLVLYHSRSELRRSIRFTKGLAYGGALVLAVAILVVALGGLGVAGDWLEDQGLDGLASRVRFWADVGEGDTDLLEDRSLSARVEAQTNYLGFIRERPFLGHGPEGSRRMLNLGRTDKMSHSLYFEKAFLYGLPHLALVLFVFFRTFQRGLRWRRALPDNASVTTILVVLLVCSGVFAGGVLESRAVMTVLGAVLGHQYVLRRQLLASRRPAPEGVAPLAQVVRGESG